MHNRQSLAERYDQHETHMFRIKICGITSVDDALVAVDAGADAIGLNFFSGSKRCVNSRMASEIAVAVNDQCTKVGVFVDHAPDDLNTLADHVGLDAVQLHGDQPPAYLARVDARYRVVRVYRLGDASLEELRADVLKCERSGRLPDAILVDAVAPGELGGTGRTLDWPSLAGLTEGLNVGRSVPVQLILAGGLTPQNVCEAIRLVRPYGVDTASGVESSPGEKDPQKLREFVAEARRGFAEIGVV